MRIVIVMPTYNERDNVARMLHSLREVFARLPHEMHLLVVDDNSPDGTAAAVRANAAGLERLHLLSGDKRGLGAAYIRGMRHALDELSADALVEMDADFSHDPADLPRMIAALEEPADFVIGSRYVSGGSIPADWGWHRKLNSSLGNVFARYIAGMPSVRDCTAGFRVIRASLLRKIDLLDLRVQGYAFQIALLYRAIAAGARIRELPVHFADRTVGESKLGFRDIAEFLTSAAWIRLQSSRTFLRFATVGLTGVAVNLGAFSLLLAAGANKFVASPLAIQLSIVWNFLLNNYWTFGDRALSGRTHVRGLKFNLVSLLSLAVSYSVFVLLSQIWPAGSPLLHQLVGIAPAMLLNYFLNSYWTFRRED